MNWLWIIVLLVSVLPMWAVAQTRPAGAPATQPTPATQPASALGFSMKNLAGEMVDLSRYQGQVVLMVNTASKCGYTPQYKQLQELHEKYAPRGLAILGFPSNDFGGQEPGSDQQIAEFCQKNYGVSFDMFSKVPVKGEQKCPLYQYLTSPQTNPASPGEVKWNFEKFLISRNGQIVARYLSKVTPDDPKLIEALEAELAKGS